MDSIGVTNVLSEKMSEGATLNSPTKIIIKKENIGLEEHQHQSYQYSLFTSNSKRDKFYEDLCKVKDRLEKAGPNMQQVIQLDMKRVNTNKLYERKLSRDLTGPRGLDWQCKQELQRLETHEREAERELVRLNLDLRKPSFSSLNPQQSPIPNYIREYNQSRSQTPRPSISPETPPMFPSLSRQGSRASRTHSMSGNRPSLDRISPILRNRSISFTKTTSFTMPVITRIPQQTLSTSNENNSQLDKHRHSIHHERQVIQEKLQAFLH